MKRFICSLCIALAVLFLFSGCPVGVDFPLGNPGKEPIDRALLGTWATTGEDPDYKRVTIEQKDDFSYSIEVFETGSMYSLDVTEFTAWVTTVEGKTFIYAQPVGSSDESYYLYHYETGDNKTMKTHDVSLLVNGTDAVISTDAYREEVKASMGKADFLSDEKIWTRQ